MPKALKISGLTTTEIECSNSGFIQDEEYKEHKRSWDSHALSRPEVWDGESSTWLLYVGIPSTKKTPTTIY